MSKGDEKLSSEEWQARHDAACAIVARKYCDMFGFWRDCRYKPCRSARRCSGDQGACLQKRCWSVSYDDSRAAHDRMIAATPPDADRFTLGAHHYRPESLCLHDPKNQKTRTKNQLKNRTGSQTKTEAKTEAKTETKTEAAAAS